VDERLRQLERQAAQGDVEAGVRVLRRKLQLGLLSLERLALASYLGELAALRVYEGPPPPSELKPWLEGLLRWDRSVFVRGVLALAKRGTVSLRPPAPLGTVRWIMRVEGAQPVEVPTDRPLLLGRSSQADVQIFDDRASRRHCEVARSGPHELWLRDLGSGNGTLVDGRLCTASQQLISGNTLRIGRTRVDVRATGGGSPRTRCLDAVQAWLDTPGDVTARALAAVASEEGLATVGSAASLTQFAVQAVLTSPVNVEIPDASPETVRTVFASALLDLTLHEEGPLPVTLPPPQDAQGIGQRVRHPPEVEHLGARAGALISSHFLHGSGSSQTYRAATQTSEGLVPCVVHASRRYGNGTPHDPAELEAWLRFEHPGVARILAGELRHEDLVVLEEASAAPGLVEWRRRRPPGPVQAATFVAQLCEPARAIAAAGLGLDGSIVSPRSVSVRFDGRPWLHSVFLAQVDDTPENLSLLGFLPPEVLDNARIPTTDPLLVYSLGALLYWLWSGRAPFVGKTPLTLFRQIEGATPASLASLGVSADPRHEALVMKALQKEPGQRPQSLLEFAEALRG
jgi:hypothetical protein